MLSLFLGDCFLINQVFYLVDDCTLGAFDTSCVACGADCRCGHHAYKHSYHYLFHKPSENSVCIFIGK